MQLIDEFLKFENENNLFDLTYHGVRYWNLIRFPIYLAIRNVPRQGVRPTNRLSPRNLIAAVKYVRQQNKELCVKGDFDLLICHGENKRTVDGNTIYPHTYFFSDENCPFHLRYLLKSTTKQLPHGNLNLTLLACPLIIGRIFRKIFPYHLEGFNDIIAAINRKFHCELNAAVFKAKADLSIVSFLIAHNFFRRIFQQSHYRGLVIICHYELLTMALTSVARDSHIPVIELQHGVMGKYHIAYQYAPSIPKSLTYTPDHIITYGDYWNETASMPKGVQLSSGGNPLIEDSKKLLADIPVDPNGIVFYSEGEASHEFCNLALEFAKIAGPYAIYFKLHPAEVQRWMTDYPALCGHNKIHVIDTDINVHDIIAHNRYHVGVKSTVLFEALAFGGTVFVYAIDGSNYLEDIVASGNACYFDSAEQLLALIRKEIGRNEPHISTNLFSENSKNAIFKLIEDIIQNDKE